MSRITPFTPVTFENYTITVESMPPQCNKNTTKFLQRSLAKRKKETSCIKTLDQKEK